jgi:hypothetical protein
MSLIVVVLLILVVLGGGAFVVWKFVLEKHEATVDTSTPPPQVMVKPPAPVPPAPQSKIVLDAPAPDEIKTLQGGLIETILADNTTVKSGEVIVRLSGDRPLEAEATGISTSVKRLHAQIEAILQRRDAAHAAGNKAAEAAAEADLVERKKALAVKQDLLATKTAELEKFLIHAPDDGTFTPVAKGGQKVVADSVVAQLQRPAVPSATFKVADTKSFAMNANIEVAVGKGEQSLTCTIAEVQSNSVRVICPVEASLAEGTAVTLKVAGAPDPVPPQPPAPAPGAAPPK